ncbi:MAG: histidinol dehydrogenase [Deltaproteobacteria bacterium]|nr:histidinol dehydrogenase [Deltaproteobacteria bacterium]
MKTVQGSLENILKRVQKIREARHEITGDVEERVARILDQVRRRGDRALIDYSRRFDGVLLRHSDFAIPATKLKEAWGRLDRRDRKAIEVAAQRIGRFHQDSVPKKRELQNRDRFRLGSIRTPMERVGVYIPGGKAVYPSTVLMNGIPAKAAGVPEIVMVTPPSAGGVSPSILGAAWIAGVTEVYQVGGAQAIGALAFGTETIRAVDKIVGPGNRYVAEAKRQVFGRVSIDMIAGPTEVVVVSDGSVSASFVAADLLAQAEHDEMAWPVLISTSKQFLNLVLKEIQKQVVQYGGKVRRLAQRSLNDYGLAIQVRDISEAIEVANAMAPEHLELMVKQPRRWARQVRHAGAIFLGAYSPVSLGDYVAGPNHVLPTGGTARFSSPLRVEDFMKESSVIEATPRGFRAVAPYGIRLARMEGLYAHARALEIRLKGTNGL